MFVFIRRLSDEGLNMGVYITWNHYHEILEVSNTIGHDNRYHATFSNRWRLEHFTKSLLKPDLDRLLNKTLQVHSGGGCVIRITVPYRT